jgi:periplasmic divalent cation tolerance protein
MIQLDKERIMTDAIAIQVTTGARHDAQAIAAALVGQRLAACVQISGPIESTFHWEGKQETCEEWLVTIKTLREKFGDVERLVKSLHPYEEPEIIALPIVAGSEGYLRWVRESVG